MRGYAAVRYAFLVLLIVGVAGDNCRISWIDSGHEVSESRFELRLSVVDTIGDESTYFPDTNYDIRIMSKTEEKFTKFYFTTVSENAAKNYGSLELRDKKLSMFRNGPHCYNRIGDGPISLDKTEMKIGWHSPPVNSGCITFTVFVRETDERYHVANKTVCQDPRVELDDPGVINRNCCACDEGKYELAFEGLWSRYYHPKHFPRKGWLATFPTVIGVSHSISYNLWRPYTNASEGLRRFAEYGYMKALEGEIKANASLIRTMMKFQGSNFQNVSGKSYAMLRVNKHQHLVSLVARIEPSPDWFIGVQSLELCLPDCTWIQRKALNLYAYDVGVRNGILYEPQDEVADELTDPPDIIQSMNMTWPPPREDGEESPFYDKTNNTHEVRPLARIYLRRLSGSEHKCEKDEVTEDDTCATPWTEWSPCSVECDKGIQKRNRTKKADYPRCLVKMNETRICFGKSKECEKPITTENCRLGEWGEWTKCEKSCGQETTVRNREYVWSDLYEAKCQAMSPQILKEIADCGNPPCPEDEPLCDDEKYLSWSNYSSCQEVKTNDGGKWYIKYRYRQFNKHFVQKPGKETSLNANTDGGYHGCLYEEISCEPISTDDTSVSQPEQPDLPKPEQPHETQYPTANGNGDGTEEPEVAPPGECFQPLDVGTKCSDGGDSISNSYYYDSQLNKCLRFEYLGCGGNENRFNDDRKCSDTCVSRGRPVDCVMEDDFPDWPKCRYCDEVVTRTKQVQVQPKNGGRPCPLSKTQYLNCADVKENCKPAVTKNSTSIKDTKN